MTRIQLRRGTTAAWAAANPILAIGEPGFDTTTGDFKVGDGVTAWLSLPLEYAAAAQGRIHTGANVDTPTVGTTPLFVGTTPSIPMVSTRKYGIYFYTALAYQTVTADSHQMHIQMDSTDMTEPGASHMWYAYSGGNYHYPGVLYAALVPTTASHIFRVRVTRIAGTGVMQVRGHLVVMDEGAI